MTAHKRKKQKTISTQTNPKCLPLLSEVGVYISDIETIQTQQECVSTLPSEFWDQIEAHVALTCVLSHLDVISVCKSSLVCKLWYQIARESFVWSALFDLYFGKTTIEKTIHTNWKNEYIREYHNFKESCMYGGNGTRAYVYFAHKFDSKFIPPSICITYVVLFSVLMNVATR